MSGDGVTLWLMLLAVGGGTFIIRFSFIWLFGRGGVRPEVQRLLRFVPPAVLAALALPAFVYTTAEGPALFSPRLAAGLVAGLVAYRSRNVLLTIGSGMSTLWLLSYFLSL